MSPVTMLMIIPFLVQGIMAAPTLSVLSRAEDVYPHSGVIVQTDCADAAVTHATRIELYSSELKVLERTVDSCTQGSDPCKINAFVDEVSLGRYTIGHKEAMFGPCEFEREILPFRIDDGGKTRPVLYASCHATRFKCGLTENDPTIGTKKEIRLDIVYTRTL